MENLQTLGSISEKSGNRSKHNYDVAFEKCNAAQKAAINTIDGPVMVIAGPGTGKTQILALRIGKLLLETDTKPEHILCLTYTDAGTIAMRQRLEQFIGAEAFRVHIHTFHSFCNKVIQENMSYFSLRDLQLLTELERVELLTELIDSFSTEHPLKKFMGDVYQNMKRLANLFDVMKSENWSPSDIANAVDAYLKIMPEKDGYYYKRNDATKGIKKGDANQKKIDAETLKMEQLRAAAYEFGAYKEMMQKQGRYDYQDMINWVIDAFGKQDTLLGKYQEQYLYFLVDEFQDTNGSQSAILTLLTTFWENPNLFVVGDDDQSIYRFQGANLRNVQDFVEKYATSLTVVMLKENYRSTQNILDASKEVIENNAERIMNHAVLQSRFKDLNKTLISQNKNLAAMDLPIVLIAYNNELHQEADIVKQIETKYKLGSDLSTVAILYRNHKQVANILNAFNHRSIPYNAKKSANLLSLPFAQNIIIILKYIAEESLLPGSGDYLLFQLMHFSYFNINVRDIAAIALAVHKKDKEPLLWRSIMGSQEKMHQLHLQAAGAISSLEANLNFWTSENHNSTLQMLFEKILIRGGIFAYIFRHEDKIALLEIVDTFFEFIKEETAKNPKLALVQLLEMLTMMDKHGIEISIHKIIKADKGVNLITAHSSKGLEFETVYLIAANEKNWEKKRSSNNANFTLPNTLTLSVEENKLEEERRLFYVAMTRAKKHLQISYTNYDLKDKPLSKSVFISEIEKKGNVISENKQVNDADIVEFTIQKLIGQPTLDAQLIEANFLNEKLKHLKLSVTHLNKYLRCPLTYYFENILQVPTARNPAMGFGKAIHYALDQLFKTMKDSDRDQFPSPVEFYLYFEKGLKKSQAHFTNKEYKDKLAYAQKLLPDYYHYYIEKWNKKVLTEYCPANIFVDKVPITGILDKIEFIDANTINVVDYKTGDPSNISKKLLPPVLVADLESSTHEEIHGGDYWRQVVFYKILLDNDTTHNWNMISGEVDFVEKRSAKDYTKKKLLITNEGYEIVKSQIHQVYDGIMSHNFTGCGKVDCQWCKFARNNYNTDLPVEEE